MARRAKGWTCRKVTLKIKCGTHNLPGTRKCAKCGTPRPARKRPAHMVALDFDYNWYLKYIALGVERCMICGRPPSGNRRLDRDHDHKTGKPRGLLCVQCNRALPDRLTIEWLEKALEYLRAAHERELPGSP